MREVFYMTKRNCLIFVRDRAAVFFSVLSMLIVLGLMVVFLGKMNSDNLVDMLGQFGERDTVQDERNAAYLVQLWTLAGILVVNAVTVTMTVLGSMVQDETRKRSMAFYVTPVSRLKLALGYILAAWIVGTVMCLLTFAAGELYFLAQGYKLLSVSVWFKVTGLLILCTFTFAAIGYLLALFVHSESAWSGLLTIIGTLVGFAGGIYLPMSAISESVQNVLKGIPVIHGASMLREVCTEAAIAETFAGLPSEAGDIFRERMGITLYRGETQIIMREQVVFLLIYAIISITAAALISRNRKLRDR